MEHRQPVARLRMQDQEYLLYAGQPARLGRSSDNDVVVNDPKISRNHAVLEWNGNGFSLRDLSSINGTAVNGQRLANAPQVLRDGDEITLSKVTLIYEIVRAAQAEPPAEKTIVSTQPMVTRGPFLIVSAGPDLGQEYPLWGECITIGRSSRDATWEIRLTDRSVSRPHARLDRQSTAFTLTDLNSANGTSVNGLPVSDQAVLLKEGDVIALGETRLVFHAR